MALKDVVDPLRFVVAESPRLASIWLRRLLVAPRKRAGMSPVGTEV